MNLLEHIIRKALFETRQRLTEAKDEWTYYDKLRPAIRKNVESIAPQVVKGFELDLSGDSARTVSAGSIARWLTDITDSSPSRTDRIGDEQPGLESRIPNLNQFLGGNYILLFGQDNRETRVEKQAAKKDKFSIGPSGLYVKTPPKSYHDIINVVVLPIGNLADIVHDVNIDKIAINAWKYPSAKGTEFERPRSQAQYGLLQEKDDKSTYTKVGQSYLYYIGDFATQLDMYKQLLPIAREMKNTPQPNGDPNRIDDINNAIEMMESIINDYPNFDALSNK